MTPTRRRRRRTRGRRLGTGLAAAAGLLTLLATPPALLGLAYGPGGYVLPPAGLSLTGQLTDTAVVDLLAAVLLLAWLRWLTCLSVEAAALLRGRSLPGILPLLTCWEQVTARRLLTAAFGLLATTGPVTAAAAATAPPPAAVTPAQPPLITPAQQQPAPPDQPQQLAGEGTPRSASAAPAPTDAADHARLKLYVVQQPQDGRCDSLWSVAERHLGDGRRYREIYALNNDRTQPDGHRLTLAQLIRPGWNLLLPADATDLPDAPPQPGTPHHPPPEVLVAPGDTLSGIADRYLGEPGRYRQIYAANAGRLQPDGTRLTNPDRILPGLRLQLPAQPTADRPPAPPRTGHGPHPPRPVPPTPRPPALPPAQPPPSRTLPTPAPTRPVPDPRPTPTPAAEAETPHAGAGTPEHERPEPARPGWTTPAWVAAGTLLATSVAGVVRFRRRRRDSRVRPGQTPPPPQRRLVALHTAVRTAEDPAAVDRVGAALQLLAAAHTGRRSPVPQVLLRRPDGTIDVYLRDRVANPTPPWTSNTDGQIWTLPAAAVATKPDRPPPCPALIQLGTTDDDAELYVDLEALGVLAIDAGGAELRAIARAVTATLTLSPLAELVRLRTTGFDPYGLATEERLTAEPTIADLLTHAADDLAPTTTGLTQGGHPTTFALRRADTGENWEPTIAVVGQPLTAADAARLGELAGAGGRGLAVIAAGPGLPARWHLTLQPATDADAQRSPAAPRWRLDPLGLALRPIQLAADELADLTALLATAAAPATDPSPAADRRPQTTTAETAADHTDQPNTAAATPARRVRTGREWTVMVRLLGTVEITDRDGRRPPPPVRDRTLEVLAWLVTHRGGSRAELEAALWPDGASPNTVMNELSRARRILRELAGPAAGDWLPTRQLTLDPAVTSDLDLLRRHLTTADRYADQPDRAIEALTAGLDLVRGVPAGYPWLDAEIGSTLTTLPVTAAVRLAELHLQRGDTDHAQAATDRGLTVLPAHTELFAVRIRIAAATAGRAAVTAEYQAYLRAERADPFYDGETDRDLRQLYQQLLRTSHRQREPDNATAQAG